jgi:hypothetical protein
MEGNLEGEISEEGLPSRTGRLSYVKRLLKQKAFKFIQNLFKPNTFKRLFKQNAFDLFLVSPNANRGHATGGLCRSRLSCNPMIQ